MIEGELKQKRNGCLSIIKIVLGIIVFSYGLAFIGISLKYIGNNLQRGYILNAAVLSVLLLSVCIGFMLLLRWYFRKKRNGRKPKEVAFNRTLHSIEFVTSKGNIVLNNPFRGIFCVGAAGSGKSESIAVPLLNQFVQKGFTGVIYDFKFPALANEVQSFIEASNSNIDHYFLNLNEPLKSHKVNPLNPKYLLNTSYVREYAQAIINNLLKESIKKPDFWTRSATDLLTACIWYLKEEHPHICDLPHVFALITSQDTALLQKLQENVTSAQMTISMYNAMQRGADGQLAGVIGTLQGAVAQINTPELMYIFSKDDFSLDINNPERPIIFTVGTYPTLANTLAPLCSLVITVATKLMNQPNKRPSFVLLDESPTCFIPNLEVLPNTGRSNKISTVLMCQDLSQLTDGYGKEKAEVLFAACNNHFYGRVASSHTSEILSKQFGKMNKTFITQNQGRSTGMKSFSNSSGLSETVQERDVIKASEFLDLGVGEFAGIAVESNYTKFRCKFKQVERPYFQGLSYPNNNNDIYIYYKQVREDINNILNILETEKNSDTSKFSILNNTQTNSKELEKSNIFDVFGD
ncbi:MAG: type IV secretory system conjugative DNA transfer family protein [Prevotella sp.]|jgi:type IV secretory pathway TraG/TraD family ATPase VirD4|nr:type IV secretory system conjugative DNA transfer family protein [Prevotella sp.]